MSNEDLDYVDGLIKFMEGFGDKYKAIGAAEERARIREAVKK